MNNGIRITTASTARERQPPSHGHIVEERFQKQLTGLDISGTYEATTFCSWESHIQTSFKPLQAGAYIRHTV